MDDIVYFKINDFENYNLDKIKDAKKEKIIFDLRGNTGGRFEDALNFLSLFVENIRIECFDYFGERYQISRKKSQEVIKGKFFILIDKYTMSSAEVVAQMFKEELGAKLIGEKTFGKNIIQEKVYLGEGIKLVIPKYEISYKTKKIKFVQILK